MAFEKIKSLVKGNSRIKSVVYNLMVNNVRTRPRLWLRILRPFYTVRGRGSVIYWSVRKDIVPFNPFSLGKYSVIEDFSVVNNFVGAVNIGDYTRIGLNNVVIGPVKIGNHVNIAQGVIMSGLDHNFDNVSVRIDEQGVSTALITIEDDVWVGSNVVITKGIKLGKHSVVAAGSVVNRDVPPFSVVAGAPARVVKQFDFDKNEWVKASHGK